MSDLSLWVGVIGVLAGAFGVWLTWRATERRDPRFAFWSHPVIGPSQRVAAEMEVLYRGQRVERLTAVLVSIWNGGRRAIVVDDLPESLRFTLPEGLHLMDHMVLEGPRIAVETHADHKSVTFRPTLVDHREGLLLVLLHDGGPEAPIGVSGAVVGAVRGFRRTDLRNVAWLTGAKSDLIGLVVIAVVMGAVAFQVRPREELVGWVALIFFFAALVSLKEYAPRLRAMWMGFPRFSADAWERWPGTYPVR